ncbi:hypothetical protein GEMRC1_004003 [Eukaryota sp. GEM-RC1]
MTLQEINYVEKKRLTVSGDSEKARQEVRLDEENRHFLEVQVWLEVVLEHRFESDWLEECRDGQLLCKLINIITPDTIPKVHMKSNMAFFCMENIQNFVKGCAKLGVDESLLFEPVDLYELRNRRIVIFCVYDLAARATHSGFKIKLRQLDATHDDINASLEKLRVDTENMNYDDVEVEADYNIDSSLMDVPQDEDEAPIVAGISFTLNIDLDDGDRAFVVGNDEKFGSWDLTKGVPLLGGDIGQWVGTIDNPPADVTFKFVKITEDGEEIWESGGARRLVLDAKECSGTVEYVATWRNEEDEEHVMRLVLEDGNKVLFKPYYDLLKGEEGTETYEKKDVPENPKNIVIGESGLSYLEFSDSSESSSWTGVELDKVVALDVDYCWLNDACLKKFIEMVPNLTRIDVSGCEDVTDELLYFISKERSGLEEILVERCRNLSAAGVTSIAQKVTQLKKLVVSRCKKMEDPAISLISEKFGSSLTSLAVTECPRLTDSVLEALAANCTVLTEVSLGEDGFTSEAIEKFIEGRQLTKFEANGCKCGSRVVEILAESSSESLKVLNLCWTNVGSGIASLSKFTSLEMLDLSNVEEVSNDDVKSFAESDACKNLKELGMTALDQISDEVFATIIKSSAETIYAVTLSGTQAGEATIEALSTVTKIQTINVSECEAIVDSIAGIAAKPSLQVLNVRKCPSITAECLRNFGQQRPETGADEATVQEVTVEVGSNSDDVDDDLVGELNEEYGERLVEYNIM